MRLFDEKFLKHPQNYLIQFALVTVSVFIILIFLHTISSYIIVASLGASSFIAFATPHTQSSRPRYLIGGYIVGILVGLITNTVNLYVVPPDVTIMGFPFYTLLCALAVGLSMIIMVLTNLEHPPAAGLALGLVVDHASLRSIMVAFIGIITLSLIKTALKPFMKDLL